MDTDKERLCITREQVADLKREAVRGKPYADRISIQLAFRLLGRLGELDSFAVIDQMDYLEGLRASSTTKEAEQFRHPPLFPLWHKHFTTARHILPNLMIRWGLDKGTGNKDFGQMFREVATECGDDPEKWPYVLSHRLTVGAYEDRTRVTEEKPEARLTGDWLIFAKKDGLNYYLDIATHDEGQNPEELIRKLRNGCMAEFPFAFE